MIAIDYHADLKEVQCDPVLAALLGEQVQASPFDRLDWWRDLAGHCGIAPLLAVARDGPDIAVLPLSAGDGEFRALSNWYSFRVRPVFSPGADAPALLTALADDLAARGRRIVLSGLPGEDGSAGLVEAAFRKAGWAVFREACDTNHILRVNGRGYTDYLAMRPGQLRTTLKRKARKVETQVLCHFDPAAWHAYEKIYASSWKPAEGSPVFLRAFAEREGAAGRLRLGLASAGGEAIAAQMWTCDHGTAYIHKLAQAEEARPLSPGTVLSAALFEHAIDRDRAKLIDFGTGDDAYKRDWMEERRLRYRLSMFRMRDLQNWPAIAKAGLRALAGRDHGLAAAA